MGVISVMGWSLSNSAAELLPNLTVVGVLGLLALGWESSLGVERLPSMVPGGEGWRRRGVMEVPIALFIFLVDKLTNTNKMNVNNCITQTIK